MYKNIDCIFSEAGQGRRFSFNSWSGRSAEPTIVPSQRRRQTVQESNILVPPTLMPTYTIPHFENKNRKFSVSTIIVFSKYIFDLTYFLYSISSIQLNCYYSSIFNAILGYSAKVILVHTHYLLLQLVMYQLTIL